MSNTFYFAGKLAELDRRIEKLYDERKLLVQKFILANSDLPVDAFFRGLAAYAGIPEAIRWYMKVYEVSILKAKREVYALLRSPRKDS